MPRRVGLHGIGLVSGIQVGHPSQPQSAAAPWWDPNSESLCIWGAWQAKGAANYAASLVDLSGNGNNLGDPGGAATPAWAIGTGWTFDGLGNYLTTTFVPQNDQSQSVLVQFANRTNLGYLCGSVTGGIAFFFIQPQPGAAQVTYANGLPLNAAPAMVAGNLGIAGNTGYRNGIADPGAIGGYLAVPAQPTYVGGSCTGGAPAAFIACDMVAAVFYDCTLTAPQMLGVATAMALI